MSSAAAPLPLPDDAIAGHRRALSGSLGRDVGHEVAILDYFLNVSPRLMPPRVSLERAPEVEQQATTDVLTGLFNWGFLESTLAQELARCRRNGEMASVVLVDLDGFQTMNDRFGHGLGDAVLRAVTGVIRRQLRASDVPCRSGGDKFAIVLPDTYLSGALLVGSRIVAEVRHHFSAHPIEGCRVAVSVSAGVASYGATCATSDALLDAAQRALEEAKAAGGDSCCGDAPSDAAPHRK
jgi:diguanylate cyclase (GGDEF)-like protein